MRTGLLTALAVAVLAGCGGGGLADATGSTGASATNASSTSGAASSSGPAPLVVTVPELGGATSAVAGEPPAASSSAEPAPSSESAPDSTVAPAEPPQSPSEPPTESPAESPVDGAPEAPAPVSSPEPAAPTSVEAAPQPQPAPAGDGSTVPVTLANCPGCTVLATHAAVTGDLSAALVASGTGRALLLSVGPDGAVRGLINIPYGAQFPAPEGGVLPCDAQARCIVSARQSDGRAILSAFELTGTGAWRDVSGNDAFPSATGEGRTVDLDGALGIAVQDGAPGAAVWMVFAWSGDRYAVVGCVADTSADPSAVALDPAACLS